jgi:phosphoserine phosphatase
MRSLLSTALAAAAVFVTVAASADPLPSWNEGPARDRILAFVAAVTDPYGKSYVAPAERIAVFDNDGTLWSEKPFYFQAAFIVDRVHAMADDHPEWKGKAPFQAVLSDDPDALGTLDVHGLLELAMASHTGMTDAEFDRTADDWLTSARHPRSNRPYTEMVYQPMLELLAFLRANGFQTWICSGGGIDLVRRFAEDVYGIPPEQVIGSGVAKELREKDGALVRLPKLLAPVNDGPGKPVWIERQIGRRPILAFGNSDGDFEMLAHTTRGTGQRLGLILHHDDAEREWAYDSDSSVGRLDRARKEAGRRGWEIVSMQRDFARVYPRRTAD